MSFQFEKLIEKLKAIKPDPGFIDRSRGQILESVSRGPDSRQFRFTLKEALTLGCAMVLASILLFVIIAGVAFGNKRLANQKSGFDITIGEASYFESQREQIEVSLNNLEREIENLGNPIKIDERSRLMKNVAEIRSLID